MTGCAAKIFILQKKHQGDINAFRLLNRYILESRWVDTAPFYAKLSEQKELTDDVKAIIEITRGQIILYWLPNYKDALVNFRQAASLVPGEAIIERTFSEYYQKTREFEKARNHALRAVSLGEHDVDNYLTMGDCYKQEEKLSLAESWYVDAINQNPLESSPYAKLISIYSDLQFLKLKKIC
jgi:tetratricopeptide (TPR) repeat protein